MAIGERIAARRAARGWSQTDLAFALREQGIEKAGQVMVSRWEKGHRRVSADELRALSTVLDVSADWLLGEPTTGDAA